MKKIISLLLMICIALSLCSCNEDKYPAQESTEEEAQVVMRLSIGDNVYEVRYELYRALFLNYKETVGGTDDSVWEGENKQEYIDKINELIINRAATIYSAFEICEKIGFDIYSSNVEKRIKEYVAYGVEGSLEENVEGYGSYEAYLASLKEQNLNYSVQELLFRYSIAIDEIHNYYIGNLTEDGVDINTIHGKLEYSKETVREFYDSDACVRIMSAYIQADQFNDPNKRAESVKNAMTEAAENGDSAVANTIIQNSISSMLDIQKQIVGRHNLNSLYYAPLTEAAFSLKYGEVSDVVNIRDNMGNGMYVLYRADKSDEHFDTHYNYIAYVYLTDTMGAVLDEAKNSLIDSAEMTDAYSAIVFSQIKM